VIICRCSLSSGFPCLQLNRHSGPTLALSRRRFDLLVQMEKIVRIVLLFDLCQAIIVGALRGGHPIAFFFRHERRHHRRRMGQRLGKTPSSRQISYGRASMIILNGVSAARRNRVNPPFERTSLKRRSPACAPRARPTS